MMSGPCIDHQRLSGWGSWASYIWLVKPVDKLLVRIFQKDVSVQATGLLAAGSCGNGPKQIALIQFLHWCDW